MLREYSEIKENSELHNQKDLLLGGTLLSKKEKRSAKGNNYAFLNFSDLSSIFELIIFESNLRKYRELLLEGESFVLGVDFTSQNEMMMHSDSILTIVTPTTMILSKYLDILAE